MTSELRFWVEVATVMPVKEVETISYLRLKEDFAGGLQWEHVQLGVSIPSGEVQARERSSLHISASLPGNG
jgi:hypothetical protein